MEQILDVTIKSSVEGWTGPPKGRKEVARMLFTAKQKFEAEQARIEKIVSNPDVCSEAVRIAN
jgi:hypothetical protein